MSVVYQEMLRNPIVSPSHWDGDPLRQDYKWVTHTNSHTPLGSHSLYLLISRLRVCLFVFVCVWGQRKNIWNITRFMLHSWLLIEYYRHHPVRTWTQVQQIRSRPSLERRWILRKKKEKENWKVKITHEFFSSSKRTVSVCLSVCPCVCLHLPVSHVWLMTPKLVWVWLISCLKILHNQLCSRKKNQNQSQKNTFLFFFISFQLDQWFKKRKKKEKEEEEIMILNTVRESERGWDHGSYFFALKHGQNWGWLLTFVEKKFGHLIPHKSVPYIG